MGAGLRRAMLRGLIRGTLKPVFGGWAPVSLQRASLHLARPLIRPTPGVSLAPALWNTVAGETAFPPRSGGRGAILYLHGGGYCIGAPASHRAITTALAAGSGMPVHVPDYRLAPEHPFPAALDDALAVYESLTASTPASIAVAGDSAGGGLALALTLAARARGLLPPAALLLLSPWVDLRCEAPSIAGRARSDPMLSPAGLRRWARLYADASADATLCSPLGADLAGLPPVLIQVGTDEILHDDAARLGRAIAAAGGRVELQVYPGLWHVFQLHARLLGEADAALSALGRFAHAQVQAA